MYSSGNGINVNASSDWRSDRATVRIGIATLAVTFAAPFLASATAELPWWANALFGVASLVVGACCVVWRRRQIFSEIANPRSSTLSEDTGKPIEEADPTEPAATPETTAPDESETESRQRWEVVEHSIRRAPIVTGEGPVLLMGYAQVDAVGDEDNKKLYFCKMYDVRTAHAYFEFRVNAPLGKLLKRKSEIRLLPGEIIVSERTWAYEDDGNANNNIVADWTSIVDESRGLIEGSERMVIVWTDTTSHERDRVETTTHRLVVPLDGFVDAEDDIRFLRTQVAMRHSLF